VEVYATLTALPGSGDTVEMLLDLSSVGSSAWDGYRVLVTGTPHTFYIDRIDNGQAATIAGPVRRNVMAGQRILGRRVGSTIELWHDIGGGRWYKALEAANQTTYPSGKIGAGIRDGDARIDDFGGGGASDASLLELYAPELRFWAEETYRADSARIATDLYIAGSEEQVTSLKCCWESETDDEIASTAPSSVPRLSLEVLSNLDPEPDFFLDQPDPIPPLSDIDGARVDYLTWTALHPEQRDVIYGRVTSDPSSGDKMLQYWMFYYYNPSNLGGFGKHEGDWEWVQVRLTSANTPVSVAFSQHGDGERCTWGPDVQVSTNGRPVAYVANGSHANYSHTGLHGAPAGTIDETADFGSAYYQTPTLVDFTADAPAWFDWDGHWGASEGSIFGPSESPKSPGKQELPWDDPFSWENGLSCKGVAGFRRGPSTGSATARHALTPNVGQSRVSASTRSAPALPRIVSARVVRGTAFGKGVRVSYCFRSLPKDPWKRPWRLHLTVENYQDDLPPLTTGWRVTKRCATVTLPVGPIKPPYALRYSVESRRATRSTIGSMGVK
jgi:hypothetical protein